MDLKKIPKDVQRLISASAYINTYTRAIEELIYNSLDADSTSIAIRVSIKENFIQVIDNGCGIKKGDFCLLGQKYTSSKYIDVCTLQSAPNQYGYRGLSLASIIGVSQTVSITSRSNESDSTWLKIFYNGMEKDLCVATTRPSKGTTVEIRGFLYNLNIQRKAINPIHELQSIKSSLEQLSLIHCNVSVSLRDDSKNKIIYKMHKKRDVYQTLWSLFEIKRDDIQELQVEKNNYKVKAFIANENALKTRNINQQWIYLNGKFVSKSEVHRKINKVFKKIFVKEQKITKIKNNVDEDHNSCLPFYFIFISCPFYDFDITYKHKQTLVEFKDWAEMNKLIEKLIQFYCGDIKLKESFKDTKCNDIESTKMKVKQIVDKILNNNVKQSDINYKHGVKGKHIKRKTKKTPLNLPNNYSPKLNTPKIVSRNSNIKDKCEPKNLKVTKCDQQKVLKSQPQKDIKKKYKTARKLKKKSKYINPILVKFYNMTDSVKYRCKILAAQRRNKPKECETKSIKITYTAEYNETHSRYKDKDELNIDCRLISKSGIRDNVLRNNSHLVKPKTSYDLIKPFNQFNYQTSRVPETPTMQFIQSARRVFNSDSCKSFNAKSTFDSHIYQNYKKTKKTLTKHLICTNSDNSHLYEQYSNTSRDNIQRFKENECNYRNRVEKYDNKEQMSRTIENRNNFNRIIKTYLHKYEGIENKTDNINLFDVIDKRLLNQSNLDITLDKRHFQEKGNNSINETYPVMMSDNLWEDNEIDLSYINNEKKQNVFIKNVFNKDILEKSMEDVHDKDLAQSLDPVDNRETIFQSNEMNGVTERLLNSCSINSSKICPTKFNYPEDKHSENLNPMLSNENIQREENISQDRNTNSELHVIQNAGEDFSNFQLKKYHELIESYNEIFDEEHLRNKANNCLNETYSVLKPNNLREINEIDATYTSNENLLNDYSKKDNNNDSKKQFEEVDGDKDLLLNLDPLNCCETVFRSNEMSDIAKEFMNSFNINTNDVGSTEFNVPIDAHNENLNSNLLRNANIRVEKNIFQDVNGIFSNSELHAVDRNVVEDLKIFQLKKRHEIMPKGMSQIYTTGLKKRTDIRLSQIDYYENVMYDRFADDVFVKSKIFAPSIQNAEVNTRRSKNCDIDNDNLIFDASSLKEAKIFGQIDRKFIATQINGKKIECNVDFLVLFDQHAVDERVKLETNLAEYFDGIFWHGVNVDSVPLRLDENELLYLHNHRQKFSQFGLQWTFQDNKISITSIPKAIIGKNSRQEQVVLRAVHRLISEEIDAIKTIGNVTLYPKAIMDLVFSEACRNAIKFGDKLSKSDCTTMLKSLSSCKTPFQCAHGRPVMAVLMELPTNINSYKVDKEKIKQFKSGKYN